MSNKKIHLSATVAKLIGVTKRTVRNMCADGRLVATRTSEGVHLISQGEVERYLKRRTPRHMGRPTLGESK
jgi:excisionase family DNA binding protein